jgi:hypothetical protein
MDIPCLVNELVVLVDCEVVGDVLHAAIFQCPSSLVQELRSTVQTVFEPKVNDGVRAVIEIPSDITELYYDAQFSYRPLATD